MKIIVKIGYQQILLPDESGIQQILKLLGKGVIVRDRLYQGKVEIEKQELELEVKTVPDSTKFVMSSDGQTEQDAEVAPFLIGRVKQLNGSARRLLLQRPGHE